MAITPKAIAASFNWDPNPAKTGKPITFTATTATPPDELSWDLNGDGVFGDGSGSSATYTYSTPGDVTVRLRDPIEGDIAGTVSITGPHASFFSFPQIPAPGQQVTFVYSPTQGDLTFGWDLDGDGEFNDGSGQTAAESFPAPGTYPVSLRVSSPDAVSTATQRITVRNPDPVAKLTTPPARASLLAPFPIIRITGRVGRRGARIRRLTVNAPLGANITVRCHGRGCPFRLSSRTVATVGRTPRSSRTVRIRGLEGRLLRVRTTVKVYVTKASSIGKFTRFKIRKGRSPLRSDLCLMPGAPGPGACPQT